MSLIRNIIGATLALAATQAVYAESIANYATHAAAGQNVDLRISGSTAVNNTLKNALTLTAAPGGECASGTTDIYTTADGTQSLTYCQGSGFSSAPGKFIAVYKESVVGSANGVQPLINTKKTGTSGIVFISPAALAANVGSCAAGVVTVATATNGQYTTHANCPNTIVAAANPDGGVADVEASMLRLSPGGGQINSNDVSLLQANPGLDVVWMVGVTKDLYYALQDAEGIPGTSPRAANGHVCTSASATPDDTPGCAPSLSRAQVASFYQYTNLNVSGAFKNLAVPSSGDNNLYVCRRDVGSGSEASHEAYFMNARCGLGSTAMAAEDGQFVFTSGGTGGVINCLGAFQNGGNITPFNKDFGTTFPVASFPGGHRYAIGVLTTELTATNLTSCSDCFRAIAVDGILPTLENTVNGYWPYWGTDAFYTIKGVASAAVTEFIQIQGKIGHPAWTALSNALYAGQPWGNGGDLAPASIYAQTHLPAVPATAATTAANPTNAYTKASSGTINNCDVPVLYGDPNVPFSQTTAPEGGIIGGPPFINQ
jgi:hypothetical protein